MEKFLLNPKDPNAFTSEVMHKVVLNGIDFELPEHIWDAIDDAFGNYWNVEVGYGGWYDLNSAVTSISNWLQNKNIIFSIDKITTIVNVMFDWIEQVPGAILDDDVVVIPHKDADFEKERQALKKMMKELDIEKEDGNYDESFPEDYSDSDDDHFDSVYISDKLKEYFPSTYSRLTKLFDDMKIDWGEINGTKDVWIRDYMPIQIAEDRYLVYNYDPDYLKDTGKEYLTDSHVFYKQVLPLSDCLDIKITLDGGNFVTSARHRFLTDKVFKENGKPLYDSEFCNYLKKVFDSDIIFLPWHRDTSQEPYADFYGHADGILKWTGGNHILMSNHRESHPEEADEIRRRLEEAGYEVIEMLFDVPNPNKEFNWAYINYLEVGNKIIVPTFGIPEDKQALKYIREANPLSIVKGFRMRDIARNGGALHCITWNIRLW